MKRQIIKQYIQCPKCPERNLITETTALINGFIWTNCLKCGYSGNKQEFIRDV